MASALDVEYARSQFPSLASGYIYADSAGGSQVRDVSSTPYPTSRILTKTPYIQGFKISC